ncbi:GIY-YIG nuclease family protein [Vampirovibrio chlorellavorus]|uniref:GIY-YIG nuclease family protein n=1 Tax=Vampirovibrio chlorellavorus TaxID=758823 RepID=UPI0026EA8327|nr:GIY-YIG nuclease family protein [Vampirovibrio chlorellavorus]
MTQSRTLKLYLADGHPAGLIVAEILNWTGKVLSFPRGLLPQVLKSRQEITKTGVYFLVGTNQDNLFQPIVYVGESDLVGQRLIDHDKDNKRAFFDQVVLIVSKDDNLTKGHIRYLEARLIDIIRKQDSAQLNNGNMGQPVNLPESDMADMEYFLHQTRTILPVLGFTFLQELPKRPALSVGTTSHEALIALGDLPGAEGDVPIFELTMNSGIYAEAYEVDGQFIVQAGAVCRHPSKMANSFSVERFGYVISDINQSLKNGTLVPEEGLPEGLVRLTRDKAFKSPSSAAMFVCGSSKNGRTYWKVKSTGQSYGDWRDEKLNESVFYSPTMELV